MIRPCFGYPPFGLRLSPGKRHWFGGVVELAGRDRHRAAGMDRRARRRSGRATLATGRHCAAEWRARALRRGHPGLGPDRGPGRTSCAWPGRMNEVSRQGSRSWRRRSRGKSCACTWPSSPLPPSLTCGGSGRSRLFLITALRDGLAALKDAGLANLLARGEVGGVPRPLTRPMAAGRSAGRLPCLPGHGAVAGMGPAGHRENPGAPGRRQRPDGGGEAGVARFRDQHRRGQRAARASSGSAVTSQGTSSGWGRPSYARSPMIPTSACP